MSLGGAERYLIDLANSLVERDIKVTMAFGGPVLHEPGPVDEVRHLEINQYKCSRRLGPLRLVVDSSIGKQLYSYIRETNVNVVNSVMLYFAFWSSLSGRFMGVPTIHTPMHVFGNYVPFERLLIGNKAGVSVTKFLRLNFIAVSDYIAHELTNIGKVPADRIHTASLGVDLEKFKIKPADDRLRKTLGLGQGPVIGSIGRLHRVKGCHKIISAMPSIQRICPETQLLLVGDGPERMSLDAQVRDLGLQDSVIFAGWQTNTVEITALMDAYIQTADGPNLGLSALQAVAQGRPLVVFASDEIEEKMAADTVCEGINGYIVPTNEPEIAGKIISKMLTGNQRLKEMGKASRKLAEERFDWQLHVSKVIETYQILIDRS